MANDTIAAVATAPGTGALAIVRVSGPQSRVVLDRVFVPDGHSPWEERHVRHGAIQSIDDGLAWFASGPHTFTGEDVAEFTGHGGALVTARVLDAFLAAGARAAEPGEFTRRAFLNGRMDLSRAEAVADVIAAASDEALRVARLQLAGGLFDRIRGMTEEVLDALAHVEATVDFPDEDLHPEGNEAIALRFEAVARDATALAETFGKGRLLREGARVVIAGRPNVGKSSLLNALVQRDRAIVTDEPGTTRDVVEEPVDFDGLPVILADTAGIRDATSLAEKEGVRRSHEAASSADLVLLVWDASEGWSDADAQSFARPVLHVANKSDKPEPPPRAAPESIRVSAKSGAGLSALKAEVRRMLLGPKAGEGEELVITRARHRQALLDAARYLGDAASAARRRESPDLIASDARRGLDSLGEITGKTTTEDLLGRIFSKFCVGK